MSDERGEAIRLKLAKARAQPGLFESAHASFFTRLMQVRIEGDYSDAIIEDEESTRELIGPANSYVNYLESLIK